MARRMAPLTAARRRRLACMRRAAQVDVAVAQAHRLVDVDPVVDSERRRLGHRQHLDRAVAQLDLSRREVRVDRALGTAAHVPATATTYSLRRSAAPSTTHWTMPVWSRRSRKARCSPCSRRRATQPQSRDLDPDVVDPERAAELRAERGGPLRRRFAPVGHRRLLRSPRVVAGRWPGLAMWWCPPRSVPPSAAQESFDNISAEPAASSSSTI